MYNRSVDHTLVSYGLSSEGLSKISRDNAALHQLAQQLPINLRSAIVGKSQCLSSVPGILPQTYFPYSSVLPRAE